MNFRRDTLRAAGGPNRIWNFLRSPNGLHNAGRIQRVVCSPQMSVAMYATCPVEGCKGVYYKDFRFYPSRNGMGAIEPPSSFSCMNTEGPPMDFDLQTPGCGWHGYPEFEEWNQAIGELEHELFLVYGNAIYE